MSKKNKKQREKARAAEVRRISGVTLRAVTPPVAKVLELKPAKAAPIEVPDVADASPAAVVSTDAPAAPQAEHRSSRRVSVAVDIHLWSDSHFFSGLSGDISEGGLFFSTYRPLSVGMGVDVEFVLPGTERSINARGKVRWIREHSDELPRGVGIAFEELADEDRDEIHAFCSVRPTLYYEDLT